MKISRDIALEIFGLKDDFSESDLKREYRRLVKIVHPDTGGDEKLFRFVDACKNLLIGGENVSEEAHKTNNKSNSHKSNTKPKKENAFIDLDVLEEVYPDFLSHYERKFYITEIRTSILVYIKPVFRNNLEKCITIKVVIPYSVLDKELNLVKFNQVIKIPAEIKRFRKFKVCIKFLNDTFKFCISDGDIKVIEHAKYELPECLKSICELHFTK